MNLFDKEHQTRFARVAGARQNGLRLEGEDARIAEVMEDHPEFDPFWPLGELAAVPQEIGPPEAETVVNPFVHTALHLIIEQQIARLAPEEAAAALRRLEASGLARHEALHRIMALYAEIYFTAFRRGEAFEEALYAEKLRELR